ncbi:WXG100 family type VII secretion target [Streptomyces sp. I05A-00742]|uniref:WXG100 family type VII secretion target n=1 Tax=Streptomyces sp. I05A-00742 TaxID=2732853 RepID=UPI0014893E1D|nr:WXG100 family type VII secretion target [Streptomyces sp. I05A-00742]
MADDLTVKDEDLGSLVKELGKMHDELEGRINRLVGAADEVKSHWQGGAARTYDELQTRVNNDVRRLKELLSFTKEAMEASRQGFSDKEIEHIQSFKGVGEGGGTGILSRF